MKTSDFDFNLPDELIAQVPLLERSGSKLMVLDKETGRIEHDNFYNIVNYFSENDVLVLNNTKVIPARVVGVKEDTGANIEILLLKELLTDTWETLVKPAKRVKIGTRVVFLDGRLIATCIDLGNDGIRIFKMDYEGIFLERLDEVGEMPLPPYIKEKLKEQNRYQTVYAKNPGSAAAPTAGLHFTNDILEILKNKGVEILYVNLHVGLGTFRPVSVDDVSSHIMHSEFYSISEEVANQLNHAKQQGKKINAVGTTTVRALESNYDNGFSEFSGDTNIFIKPGYKFEAVDNLITNFHLPKSTLLMLVSALASKDIILNAYNQAVENKYRFFSFGDSMFIKGE